MKQSKRYDYLDSNYEMDLTSLERLPVNTGIPLLDKINKDLNEQSDRLEDMFTEIACNNMDNMKRCAFYKELSKSKTKKSKKKPVLIDNEDDFDTNNPDYLAILEEVNNNPRD